MTAKKVGAAAPKEKKEPKAKAVKADVVTEAPAPTKAETLGKEPDSPASEEAAGLAAAEAGTETGTAPAPEVKAPKADKLAKAGKSAAEPAAAKKVKEVPLPDPITDDDIRAVARLIRNSVRSGRCPENDRAALIRVADNVESLPKV